MDSTVELALFDGDYNTEFCEVKEGDEVRIGGSIVLVESINEGGDQNDSTEEELDLDTENQHIPDPVEDDQSTSDVDTEELARALSDQVREEQTVFLAKAGMNYEPAYETAVFSTREKAEEWLEGRGPSFSDKKTYDWTEVESHVIDGEVGNDA